MKNEIQFLKKILGSIIIMIVVLIILSANLMTKAADYTPSQPGSTALTLGTVNTGDGGTGLTAAPEPYLFGELFCVDHGINLTRTEEGRSAANANNIVRLTSSSEDGSYYNQQIGYGLYSSPASEQSLTAAFITYKIDKAKNLNKGSTLKLVQKVVWSSGQWNNHPGYVNNLNQYLASSAISYNPGSGDSGSVVYERAEAWANFYYNVLQVSGGNVNIVSEPQNEDELRVYVDQNARTYTQGGYSVDIVNSSGNVISDNRTEHYGGASTLGELITKEILGTNLGSSVFQFCRLKNSTATITYTDGSTEEYQDFEFLNANGNVVEFPVIGQNFYIRVTVPQGETRTIAKIEPHFELEYLTQLNGKSYIYRQSEIIYELDADELLNILESSNLTVSYLGEETVNGVVRNKFKFDSYDTASAAINEAGGLSEYIKKLIENHSVYQAQNANHKYSVYYMPEVTFDEQNSGLPFWGDYVYNGMHFGTLSQVYDHIYERVYPGDETASVNEYNSWLQTQGSGDYQFYFTSLLPVVKETRDYRSDTNPNVVQPIAHIVVTPPDSSTPVNFNLDIWSWCASSSATFDLIGKDCTIEIGGKVWVDVGATKESTLNGRLHNGGADTGDYMYGGMLVKLFLARDRSNPVASTTTDSNGLYHFDKLNALEKYVVVFEFNGQLYQQTYYFRDYNLSGGFSNAQEIGREAFNSRFEEIDSYPGNYYTNGWHIAYGKDVKLRDSNGNYIAYGDDALTYIDAWNQFVIYARDTKSYDSAYGRLRTWLQSQGVGQTDINGVIQFIIDCMIDTQTTNLPVYNQFVIEDIDHPESQPATETAVGRTWNSLYISSCDQSRNVDFGINERDTADLALQKDVYKATLRVNGKTQTYMYDNKNVDEDGNWDIEVRVADQSYSGLYNGDTKYTREIRNSEYLYDGSIYNATESQEADPRDLRVFITYRIVVRNQSQTYDTKVNELVDYFDADEYLFDGVLNTQTNIYENNSYADFEVPKAGSDTEVSTVTSYIGDKNGNYVSDLTVSTTSTINSKNGRQDTNIGTDYDSAEDSKSPIYLSGIVMPDGNDKITKGGGMTYIYLTFEVKKHTDKNNMPNRIQMDVDVSTPNGEAKGNGKQNIAEINSYSTYYASGEKVPGTRDNNNVYDIDVSGRVGGLIDRDSTVGNLSAQDLNSNGDLIISDNPLENRTEDDTDKAPNVRLIFPDDNDSDSNERVATGYVYEDIRNVAPGKTDQEGQENNQSMIGNGRYSESDQDVKINGVTVQLVELVQEVNDDGIPTGEYLGEYVWGARRWNKDTLSWESVSSNNTNEEVIDYSNPESVNKVRFYSGQGAVEGSAISPIISGVEGTVTEVSGITINENGQYAFKAMPAGDFIIRFIYGDTTQTVLTTSTGEGEEVTQLLNNQTPDYNDGYISISGLNNKSYNGQDYKSTIYQSSIDESGTTTKVTQEGSYNGINGFVDYDLQNYYINKRTNYNEFNTLDGNTLDNDGHGKDVMYYYNISESEKYAGISDAKDVGNIRENSNNYSKGIAGIDGENDTPTIVNGRAEVLVAGLKVASTEKLEDGAETSVNKQISMIKELMNNTSMISQSGVINTTVEYNTDLTIGQSTDNTTDSKLAYTLKDIDLGLSERPIAQLVMNKEVANVRITLQNGTILFDTNRSVTNMPFAEHAGHKITYSPEDPNGSAYRLKAVEVSNNSTNTPELITTYMDEELMYGARIEVDYAFTVTNVGEVDYLDNQFYYTGVTNDTSASNISTTTANTVVDYVTNNMQFLPTNSNNSGWSIRTVEDLTSDPSTESTDYEANPVGNNTDLINNKYYNTLNTYNTIVTSKDLALNLYPEEAQVVADEEVADPQSSSHTTMMLSTTLTPDSGEDTMVYNNLCEIIQVSNSQGRRLKWSVTGNQPMANQDSGSVIPADPDEEQYTKVDLVTPKEIDADSSQEILILPPTGANRNYTLWIIVGVIALVIIAGGVILIRRYFKKK